MLEKYKRYFLKTKEAKLLLNKVSERVKFDFRRFLATKAEVELFKTEFAEIYLFNGKPLIAKAGENVFPTLVFNEFLDSAPKVIVDMGAVPHVCNGANVMAPGVVGVEGQFGKGEFVIVIDERHRKPLALGETLYSAEEMKNIKHGAVVKNIHFAGDRIWELLKKLAVC
jgi:PUA domain protein